MTRILKEAGYLTGVRGPAATGLGKQLRAAQARVVVPFEDNRHLNRLLGEYDGHLALLEERLGIEAQAHGNVVTLTGPAAACETAREVLEKLYARIRQGEDIGPGDVDGLLRHAPATKPRPPTGWRRSARAAASSRRARRCRAPTSRRSSASISCSASGPPAPARPIWPSPTPRNAWSAGRSTASCCRVRRWRRASGWASCPATCARRSIPTCARSTTRSTTCCRRPRWSATSTTGVIEIAPLAFMRGRTLAHSFVILDEAQNTTSMQMKMFLTRIGEGSKMVVTGDPSQIDLPSGQRSGLEEAVGLLDGVRGIEAIRFTSADVVRRDLVARIVEAYDKAG